MRTLLVWALVLLVSGCADRSERPASTGALASIPAGPDPIVLRVSRGGGLVSALSYPSLDSMVWRSSYRLPPIERILGYHADDGYLTAVDTSGRPVRLDLRLGAVALPGAAGGSAHASADGAVIFALNVEGNVARYTPVGDRWTMTPNAAPRALIPLNDGSLVIAERASVGVLLRRVRPPDTTVVDSMRLDVNAPDGTISGVTVGDRMFVSAGSHVMAWRTRDFVRDVDVDLGEHVRHFVTSPSGDRVFVVVEGANEVRVADRFEGEVVSTIELPAEPRALRMDALGRVLLVQAVTDSVYLIDIGTSKLIGAARTEWRGDLPLVLPDGAVALANGDTVTLISSIDLGEIRSLPTGARDTWFAMRWNGFRPRAAGLDEPVRFREGTGGRAPVPEVPSSAGDSGALVTDTANAAADVRADSGAAERTPPRPRARTAVFTVQFAAVLTEALAREATSGINVDGRTPRIATSVRDGRTMYRVVMGPFSSREEAERVGKASGRSYWVFEGAP